MDVEYRWALRCKSAITFTRNSRVSDIQMEPSETSKMLASNLKTYGVIGHGEPRNRERIDF